MKPVVVNWRLFQGYLRHLDTAGVGKEGIAVMWGGRDLVLIAYGVQDDPVVQDHLRPQSRRAEGGPLFQGP